MKMDIGLDTGDILLIRETIIGADENAVELMERLAFTGAELLSQTLAMFDELKPQPQNHAEATLAPIMRKEDGAIDWNLSAKQISNRIRGFQPFPTSFTKYQDKKLTIWKASPTDNEERTTAGGQILAAKGEKLFVSCGNQTVLQIEELQIEGKRRMMTCDFLNGVKMQTGEKLG
jgi:methionyl-tRNA formyltransferase